MGGKKGSKKTSSASKSKAAAPVDADVDAMLDEAAAENAKAKQVAEDKAEEEAIAAMEEQMKLRREMAPDHVLIQQVCAKLDQIPTFCVMNEAGGTKKFVPLCFADEAGVQTPQTCACFIDPDEAKTVLQQAAKAAPDMNLGIGVLPLGKALALAEGWAVANGTAPFSLRASAVLRRKFQPLLARQLEQKGVDTFWYFPVFMCSELQSETVLPVFLDPDAVAEVWAKAGKTEPVPTRLVCLDLRLVAQQMLKPFHASGGADWSIVRFVGTERGWKEVEAGLDAAIAAGDEPPMLEPDPQTGT